MGLETRAKKTKAKAKPPAVSKAKPKPATKQKAPPKPKTPAKSKPPTQKPQNPKGKTTGAKTKATPPKATSKATVSSGDKPKGNIPAPRNGTAKVSPGPLGVDSLSLTDHHDQACPLPKQGKREFFRTEEEEDAYYGIVRRDYNRDVTIRGRSIEKRTNVCGFHELRDQDLAEEGCNKALERISFVTNPAGALVPVRMISGSRVKIAETDHYF